MINLDGYICNDELMTAIKELLQPLTVEDENGKKILNSIRLLTHSELEKNVRIDETPLAHIFSVGEELKVSGISNTRFISHLFKVRVITRSVNLEQYKLGENNIYRITTKMLQLLMTNKDLDGRTFRFNNYFNVRDLEMLSQSEAGYFQAREITIEYASLIAYAGAHNRQSSIALPKGIQFNN